MSDSIVRLKVDSSEWNNKLKNASVELNRYMDGCRKAGGTLEILDEGVMDVVKALGDMETKATTSRGQMRELTEALSSLTASYRGMSDAERSSDTGKAMEEAMAKLTKRAGDLRDAMDDVNRAIKGQASDTRVFDQLSGGAQMVTASFQTLQGAGKMLGFEIGNDVEVIAKLQAAMAVTTGLTQIQNAVQNESAVMQGILAVQAKAAAAAQALQTSTVKGATIAQAAFNSVAKANPYVLLASAVAAVGTAMFAFSVKAKDATAAIKTNTQAMDEAKRMAGLWNNTMQGTFASMMTKYDELKRQWISLKDEHQRTEWIKKNQQALAGLGQSITDVKGAEDFFAQNTDAVVSAFVRRAQAAARVAQLTELYRKQIELIDKKQQTQSAIANDARAYGRSANAGDEIKDETYWNSRYGAINQRTGRWEFHEAGAKLYSGTDTSTASSVQKIDVQIQANQQEIEKVKSQIENDFKDVNVAVPTPLTKGNTEEIKKEIEQLKTMQEGLAGLTEKSATWFVNDLKTQLAKTEVGTEMFKNVFGKLADATSVKNLLEYAIRNGIDTAVFPKEELMEKLINGDDISNTQLQGIVDRINTYLKDKKIELDFTVGTIEESSTEEKGKGDDNKQDKDKKKSKWKRSQTDDSGNPYGVYGVGKMAGGINSLVSSVERLGIELPQGLKQVFGGIQAVTSILTSIMTIVEAIEMIQSSTSFLPFFASGGVVPHAAAGAYIGGTHYSGDVTPVFANAGELILNKASQNNLASALQDIESPSGGGAQPFVSGEQIYLGLTNYLRRSGRGELMTARR